MSKLQTKAVGYWLESARGKLPTKQKVEWTGAPRRAYTATVDGKVLAVIRHNPYYRTWIITMPGFMWDVSDDTGTGHQALKINYAPVKAIKRAEAAMTAVNKAYKLL